MAGSGQPPPLPVVTALGGQPSLVRHAVADHAGRDHDVAHGLVVIDGAVLLVSVPGLHQTHRGRGVDSTVRERLSVLTTKGYAKFFRNHEAYGLPPATRSKFLCVEGMLLGPAEEVADPGTGEVTTTARPVLPTHYKCPQSGAVLPVENPEVWVYLDDGEAVG